MEKKKASGEHPALITVNRSYRTKMTGEKLASYLREMVFPKEHPDWEQIEVFFSEVPVSAVVSFCREFGVSLDELRRYYEKYVKNRFRNEELEQLWEL